MESLNCCHAVDDGQHGSVGRQRQIFLAHTATMAKKWKGIRSTRKRGMIFMIVRLVECEESALCIALESCAVKLLNGFNQGNDVFLNLYAKTER